MRKKEFGWGGGKSLLAIIAQAAWENQGCSNMEVSPFKCFVFLILGYKFDNLSIDWWIYFFNIP